MIDAAIMTPYVLMSYKIKLQELMISSTVNPCDLGFDCEKFDEMFSEFYTENLLPTKAGRRPALCEFLESCEEGIEFLGMFPRFANAEMLFLYECSECGTTSREFIKDEECELCKEIAHENEELKKDIMYHKL